MARDTRVTCQGYAEGDWVIASQNIDCNEEVKPGDVGVVTKVEPHRVNDYPLRVLWLPLATMVRSGASRLVDWREMATWVCDPKELRPVRDADTEAWKIIIKYQLTGE